MRSMTGYGRGSHSEKKVEFTVVIASVNRKQRDIVFLIPKELAPFQDQMRKVIEKEVARGRLEISIQYRGQLASSSRLTFHENLFTDYLETLKSLEKKHDVRVQWESSELWRMPGLFTIEETSQIPQGWWTPLRHALQAALDELNHSREREGKILARDMQSRAQKIQAAIPRLHKLRTQSTERYRRNLHQRLEAALLPAPLEDERILKEIALFADRCDITEELTRLESHLQLLKEYLTEAEKPMGRAIEFLLQEIQRECTTIAAKANDSQMAQIVVTCKTEIEKIREQVQNIE